MIDARLEQTGALQPVKERVKGAGTDAVAVVLEFLHHGEAEDWLVGSMDKHVEIVRNGLVNRDDGY